MKKYTIIFILLSVLFTACEKEIKFDKKLVQPRLVLNSFITSDSIIDVKISASKSIPGVERTFVWPEDATVKLFVDDVETETLKTYLIDYPETEDQYYYYDETDSRPRVGYHTVNTKAETGKTYRLEVSHPDYETATSETYIPEQVKILSHSSEEVTENRDGYNQKFQTFKIKFKDPDGEKNYYRLSINNFSGRWMRNWEDESDTSGFILLINQEVTQVMSDDRLLNPDEEDANDFLFGSPSNVYNLFTDDFIDGKEHELEFSIGKDFQTAYSPNGDLKDSTNKLGEFNWYTISLQSITEEAYLYMRASYAQHWYGDDFFSEPVQAYSNVENGVGIFAGYNSSSFSVKEGEYPIDGVVYQDNTNMYYY